MSVPATSSGRSAAWTINGRFMRQRLTGVQRYALEIVRAMDDVLTNDRQLAGAIGLDLVVPPGPAVDEELPGIEVRMSAFGSGHFWDQVILPFHARDGVLSLGNFGPIVSSRHVVCIHDANTFVMPESYSFGFRTAYRLLLPLVGRRARKVATVSQFSADMLARHGIAEAGKIVVIPNGHEHVRRWDSARANPGLPIDAERPFVLVIGSKARHKNISTVLSISDALDKAGVDIVVAGGSSGIFAASGESRAGRNVRNVDYVTDDDLAALYNRALCLVFPSRIEGFGLPVLEAMACGCPVIASHAASLPEVGGDAVLYADPDRPDQWLAAIVQLLRDPAKCGELKEKGRVRAGMFSWRRSAQQYLDQMLELS
jgi:glycosyltransferase involved in cell wall biosynthesis